MRKYLLPMKGTFYKAALHCHTSVSDGRSTPEEVKQYHIKKGYQIVAFTDHQLLADHQDLNEDGFLALNGYEYAINGEVREWENMETCHIGLIALDPGNLTQICYHRTKYSPYLKNVKFDKSEPDYELSYTPECISDVMRIGREKGFFVIYNHPTASIENYTHYANYHNMHAVELYEDSGVENQRVYDDMLRCGKRIYAVGCDDSHNEGMAGISWTMIKAEKLDYPSIAAALTKGDFYASQGPEIHELYIEDSILHIKTSDIEKVEFIACNRRGKIIRANPGELMNEAAYSVNPDSKYVRVIVTDATGKTASTNAYFADQLA